MQPLARVLVLTFGLVLLGTPASAVVLSPGDIVVLHKIPGELNPELLRVEPSSGAVSLVANTNSCPALAGALGEHFAAEASGNVVVATEVSPGSFMLIRVDPENGTCSTVAAGLGTIDQVQVVPAAPLVGASAISGWGIVLAVGMLLGLSLRLSQGKRMRPFTRSLLLTFGLVLMGTSAAAVVLSVGDIVAMRRSSFPFMELLRVDPSSGAVSLIANTNTCPALGEHIAVEASGDVLVSFEAFGGVSTISRVDPENGTCSTVAAGLGTIDQVQVVPAAPLVGASAISGWGIALVVGMLLGLSFRLGRRSAARMA